MKTFSLLITLLICFITADAQKNKIDSIISLPEIKQLYYEMEVSGSKVMYLPMEYGKSGFTINQQIAVQELKKADIAGVDLVYSDFPAKADFTGLNKKRLETLKNILPSVFSNANKTMFRNIRQTGARNKTEAGYLQHGFFIYYRPKPEKGEGVREIKKMDKILKAKTETALDTITKICSGFWFAKDGSEAQIGEGYTISVKKIAKKDIFKERLSDEKSFNKDYPELRKLDSVYYVLYRDEDSCDFVTGVYEYEAIDTTVSSVLKRHSWESAVVIADVTGSMYPYTAQLLLWLKLKIKDGLKRPFIFFNDGDDKRDDEKVIGKTGGIYSVTTAKYDDIEQTIIKAMKAGCGGDAPENNIEAILQSDKLCAGCDSVIMIADNWAPVKDLSLLAEIKKPVKIILCGVYGSVNTDYLNIARKTKGSIHLIERDIYELSKMHEGDTIEIGGHKYKIVDGEFKQIIKKIM